MQENYNISWNCIVVAFTLSYRILDRTFFIGYNIGHCVISSLMWVQSSRMLTLVLHTCNVMAINLVAFTNIFKGCGPLLSLSIVWLVIQF